MFKILIIGALIVMPVVMLLPDLSIGDILASGVSVYAILIIIVIECLDGITNEKKEKKRKKSINS